MVLFKSFALSCLSMTLASSDYEQWKSDHQITIPAHEDAYRSSIFTKNHNFIKSHNARHQQGLETYTVALNKFAAMTTEEFTSLYLSETRDVSAPIVGQEYPCPDHFEYDPSIPVPASLSYVAGQETDGDIRVTMVKDQGQCGSCWTFGTMATLEATMCKNGLKDCSEWHGLSTQQIVDCASYTRKSTDPNVINLYPYDNHGCNGGLESNALRYCILNEGVNEWDDYPYVSGTTQTEGECAYEQSTANLGIITNCGEPTPNDENEMVQALSQIGPLVIAIDASGDGFRFYSTGVYSSTTCSNVYLNHAVASTGYGSLDGQDYFQVKNSWGTDWGNQGYILMSRNNNNNCGVASDTHYAVM